MAVQPDTPAHLQTITHHYIIAYPEHGPRESDPNYADFHAYKAMRKKAGTLVCDFAIAYRNGDTSECDTVSPLECHHKVIEFALLNGVDLALLEAAYPGVSAMGVGKWIESAVNLELLCVKHHRSTNGVHKVSYSDYGASMFFRDMFRDAP